MTPFLFVLACTSVDPGQGLAPSLTTPEDPAPPFVVLTVPALEAVAQDWAAYRSAQGFDARVLIRDELVADPVEDVRDGQALAESVAAELTALQEGAPDQVVYLLLLGDVLVDGEIGLPAVDCQSAIGDCYTDNAYGDPDLDHVPRFAVGRVPADSAAAAAASLEKLRQHEGSYTTGLHNRRFFFYAGDSGFDPQLAGLVETLVLGGLAQVDPAYDIIGLYNDPTSSFYYSPFEEKVVELMNEGSVLAMYLGHGASNYNDGLGPDELAALECENRLPVLALFACNNGAYAAPTPSVAELALARPLGPIVAFAGSDITHPYSNGVYPYELQRALFSGAFDTVGAALLETRRQVADNQDELRQLLLASVTMEGVSVQEAAESLVQHQDLYNLLGDPAASLHLPGAQVELDFSGSTSTGTFQVWGNVTGLADGLQDGTAWVTVEVPRDQMLGELQPLDPDHPDEQQIQDNWAQAIDTVIAGVQVPVVDGAFQAQLDVPGDLPGNRFYLKAYAWDGSQDAIGVQVVP